MNTTNMWYHFPNSTDTQGMFELMRYVNNEVTAGFFFPVILLIIFVISFLAIFSSKQGDESAGAKAWVFASFLTSVLAILLGVMGMMSSKFMYLSIIMFALGLLWLKLDTPSME